MKVLHLGSKKKNKKKKKNRSEKKLNKKIRLKQGSLKGSGK